MVKKSDCNAGDTGLIPGSGRSLEEGNPFQYSCLESLDRENSMVGSSPWDHKELDMAKWLKFHWQKVLLNQGFIARWRRKWQPTPVFLTGEFQGQRSLVDYSPLDHKELGMTEWPTFNLIVRRDKKDFLNEQYKDLEEKIRMRKNRDLFKKIVDIKGTFHARMSMIKDRNGKTQKRLRRGGKNTQKNYTRKLLMTWISMTVWSLT